MNIAVTIQMPEQIATFLAADGADLSRRVLEAVAIENYRRGDLSVGQVAEMLEMSVIETEGFLHRHNVELLYTLEDFEQDRAGLHHTLEK